VFDLLDCASQDETTLHYVVKDVVVVDVAHPRVSAGKLLENAPRHRGEVASRGGELGKHACPPGNQRVDERHVVQ